MPECCDHAQEGTIYASDLVTPLAKFVRMPLGNGYLLYEHGKPVHYNSDVEIKKKFPGCVMKVEKSRYRDW